MVLKMQHTTSSIHILSIVSFILLLLIQPKCVAGQHETMEGFEDLLLLKVPSPTKITWFKDNRMLVTEKNGRVWVFDDPTNDFTYGKRTKILDLAEHNLICHNSERGLGSIAIHPDYDGVTNQWVYVYYTFDKPGNLECLESATDGPVNRLSRLKYDGVNSIDIASEEILLDTKSLPADHHNAGDLRFGKDGYLYCAIGDGGAIEPVSQDLSTLFGKVLRITDSGGIPPSNPYTGSSFPNSVRCNRPDDTILSPDSVCEEIFASGLRNPFRFAMDPNTEVDHVRFFINDVGGGKWEEISVGGTDYAGANYGWPLQEGPCVRRKHFGEPFCSLVTDDSGFEDPYHYYLHDEYWNAAITGGAFIPNGIWPEQYDGSYLYADYIFGKMYMLKDHGHPECRPNDGCNQPVSGKDVTLFTRYPKIVNMEFGPWKNNKQVLYYSSRDNNGEIRIIEYVGKKNRNPIAVLKADVTSGKTPLTVTFDASSSFDNDGDELFYEFDFGTSDRRNLLNITLNLTPVEEDTESPTSQPTRKPTLKPTAKPTAKPTQYPTPSPTRNPTPGPFAPPTSKPTAEPTAKTTAEPTAKPTPQPSTSPLTLNPTPQPSDAPVAAPTTKNPTPQPTSPPTKRPEPTCMSWCPTHSESWAVKCGWLSCTECSVCNSAAPTTLQPTPGPTPLPTPAPVTTPTTPRPTYPITPGPTGTPTLAPTPSPKTATFTYTKSGLYVATLTVRDRFGGIDTDTIEIGVGTPPKLDLVSPVEGATFAVGDRIILQATAIDDIDGQLDDMSFEWEVRQHHSLHFHPFLEYEQGNNIKLHGAPPPEDYDAATNSYLEIICTAKNSLGIKSKISRNVYPRKVKIDFDSEPSGLQLLLDGTPITTPATATSWEGHNMMVNADDDQLNKDVVYSWAKWSDGGSREHQIYVGPELAGRQSYVATFDVSSSKPSTSPTFTPAPTTPKVKTAAPTNQPTVKIPPTPTPSTTAYIPFQPGPTTYTREPALSSDRTLPPTPGLTTSTILTKEPVQLTPKTEMPTGNIRTRESSSSSIFLSTLIPAISAIALAISML